MHTVGVMGSAAPAAEGLEKFQALALCLGQAISSEGCTLITGETTGLSELVSRAVRDCGGLTVGISAAHSRGEHQQRYNQPTTPSDVVIYTGFGLKGRNVINVRSCDIVIIFGGSIGTLNEFTIAYDEGKVIGILEGSGGVADGIRRLVDSLGKPTRAQLCYSSDPGLLIMNCIELLKTATEPS